VTVELHERVDPVSAEWDALADAIGAKPWYRPGWFAAWLQAFGRGRSCILTTRDRGGGLRGVLPLLRVHGGLRSAANWHSPDFGVIGVDGTARAELAAAMFRTGASWIRLSPLDPANGLDECGSEASRARHRFDATLQVRSPYVPLARLDGSVPATARPGKRRTRTIARARLELAGDGLLELDVQDGTMRLDALLAEGFALEGSGWKAERATAIRSDPTVHRFYVDVARWASDAGLLRLCFLRVGGRAIAFEFALDDGRSLYDLKGGYDPALRRHVPGFVMVDSMIAYARTSGRESFEFLGDAEPFKLEWTDRVRDRIGFAAFAPTAFGMAARAFHAYARPVAKRVLGVRAGR
jgi:CelD/BcsL family acetyltransferase involved in cellulose biosynthesis